MRREVHPDSWLPELWHGLPELSHRVPGRQWSVEYVTLSLGDLRCPYEEPGGQPAHGGYMTACGWSADVCLGRSIPELANGIQAALNSQIADVHNPSLARVLTFMERGPDFIRALAQPMAFIICANHWWVREGMHRAVALALLGVKEWEAVCMSTMRQDAA